MAVGLFGGSFDPIHFGHIKPVLEAQRQLGLERVIYLPTASPPHKPERSMAPALARYAMVELALLDHPNLEVSTFELEPGGPAYTIETIERFSNGAERGGLVLIIGEDSFLQLPSWRRWEEIVDRVEIAVLARPDGRHRLSPEEQPEPVRAASEAGRVHLVRNEPVSVSSTELRRLLRSGEPVPEGWVPDLVIQYLKKYPNLYV